MKKTILIDLDGVLNTYVGCYDENYIPPIRDGAFEFIKKLANNYRIILFTTRNCLLTAKWILKNNLENYIEDITNIKKPCFLIIDDRTISFNGNYSLLEKQIKDFKPWYKK